MVDKVIVRVVSVLILGLLSVFAVAGCFHAMAIPNEDLTNQRYKPGDQLRLTYPKGSVILFEDFVVKYPYVEGEVDEVHGEVAGEAVDGSSRRRFNVEDATKVEIVRVSRGRTAATITTAVLGGLGLMILTVVAFSCPTVYVGSGPQAVLVGEAYPGAIFGSMRRTDYLALPDGTLASPTRVSLRNEHDERQYVGSLKLGVVRHAPGEQAIATADGILLVGEEARPLSAVANGSDASGLLALRDGRAWQSVPTRGAAGGADRVDVSFVTQVAGEYAVVVTAENTRWFEATFGHAIRTAGSRWGELLDQANRSPSSRLGAWRDAAGIDLEIDAGAVRARALPFGTAGFRRASVATITSAGGETVKVSLRAGAHLWRIDAVELVRITSRSPVITFYDSAVAKGSRAVAYPRVLAKMGESIDAEFAVPASPEPRTAFLITNGYYNVNPPRLGRRGPLMSGREASRHLAEVAGLD